MSNLKTIPLHNFHRALGAKMVSFAHYEMPIRYTLGIIKEHIHCRHQAGFFDLSHMGHCLITGSLAGNELEKLTPSNITGLAKGQQRYSLLTNSKGGIIDDIIITHTEKGYLLIVNAACKEKVFVHLNAHLSSACQLEIQPNQVLFALQGPAAATVMAQLSTAASKLAFMQSCHTQIATISCLVSRCGYTGEDGFEISFAKEHAETLAKKLLSFDSVLPIGLGARDTLRLEAGLALYGHELSESISPIEAGLKWTFRNNARHFLGSEIIQSQIGNPTIRKRVGLIVEGKTPIRENTQLFDQNGQAIGIITSGNFSPSLKRPIALALINSAYKSSVFFAKVRNRTLTCNQCQLPFVPHNFHR